MIYVACVFQKLQTRSEDNLFKNFFFLFRGIHSKTLTVYLAGLVDKRALKILFLRNVSICRTTNLFCISHIFRKNPYSAKPQAFIRKRIRKINCRTPRRKNWNATYVTLYEIKATVTCATTFLNFFDVNVLIKRSNCIHKCV